MAAPPSTRQWLATPRREHYVAAIGSEVYIWAGYITDFPGFKRGLHLRSTVEVFNPLVESWREQFTGLENLPPALINGASAVIGRSMYVCCGCDGLSWYNSLCKLDSSSHKWARVKVVNPDDGPVRKSACDMIAIDGNKLLVIGGFVVPVNVPKTGRFIKLANFPDLAGWTNEMHQFCTKEGKWSVPATTGDIPPPCSDFTFTVADSHRAVLFAGRVPKLLDSDFLPDSVDDALAVDDAAVLDYKIWHWTKLHRKPEDPWPKERAQHAACCITFDGEDPQLLISGGKDIVGTVLADAWLLNVNMSKWKELHLPEGLRMPRWGHSMTAITYGPGLTEVIMAGGSDDKASLLADTILLRLESIEISSIQEWVITGFATGGQLGQRHRLMEKKIKLKEHEAFIKVEAEHKMGADMQPYEQKTTAPEGWVKQAELKGDESKSKPAGEAEETIPREDKPSQLSLVRRVAVDEVGLEERKKEAQHRASDAEGRARERLNAETGRREAGQAAERGRTEAEEVIRENYPPWVVEREEIEMTGRVLGTGAYAVVTVANFRGISVAAKKLHQLIISNHNRWLFNREMNIAAKVRHPNLVLFIGATIHGELIILTELMFTSLRAEIEHRPLALTPPQRKSIAIDVVAALNYLHLMRPDPIIHRDISSANILLDQGSNNTWRAKVADLGTANFLRQIRTQVPGAPPYAAPEASIPHLQSDKMDIFSFGALLVEMFSGELPVTEIRERLIQSIQEEQVVNVIRRCTAEEKDLRPTAFQVMAMLRDI